MERIPPEPRGHRNGVFGLATQAGRVLLVQNTRLLEGRPQACWDLPGGTLEPGEDLVQGLEREWQEECGAQAAPGELLWVVDGRKQRPSGTVLYTWRAFCFEVTSTGPVAAGQGIDAADWVPLEQAAARLSAPYHGPVRAWLAGVRQRYHRVVWEDALPPQEQDPSDLRALFWLVSAAAVGDSARIRRALQAAAQDGESPARVIEALLQVVPYAGFPRAIHALTLARAVLGEDRVPCEEEDAAGHGERGAATFARVYGETASSVRAGLSRLDERLARWTLEFAYGRVLAPEHTLSLLERELLAVALLTALGNLRDPLLGHQRAALRLGATQAQLAAAARFASDA